ncbi:hypothetical protein MOX02_03130 [Methylobacterium oxalidis]|nr:hypothetical protein MOX02_03130 [Methylobacterium oxalidis]
MLRHAEELLSLLKRKALVLDEVHEHVRLLGGSWTRDQLELFLLCASSVTRDDSGVFQAVAASADDALQTAIVEAVRSFAGKPVPAGQVRARLPQHFVTSDEQVLAVARHTTGLEVFGPKLIRPTR